MHEGRDCASKCAVRSTEQKEGMDTRGAVQLVAIGAEAATRLDNPTGSSSEGCSRAEEHSEIVVDSGAGRGCGNATTRLLLVEICRTACARRIVANVSSKLPITGLTVATR